MQLTGSTCVVFPYSGLPKGRLTGSPLAPVTEVYPEKLKALDSAAAAESCRLVRVCIGWNFVSFPFLNSHHEKAPLKHCTIKKKFKSPNYCVTLNKALVSHLVVICRTFHFWLFFLWICSSDFGGSVSGSECTADSLTTTNLLGSYRGNFKSLFRLLECWRREMKIAIFRKQILSSFLCCIWFNSQQMVLMYHTHFQIHS